MDRSSETDAGPKPERNTPRTMVWLTPIHWKNAVTQLNADDPELVREVKSGDPELVQHAIKTEPDEQIGFNAPFVKHQRSNLRLTNGSAVRVMWAIKSTNRRVLLQPVNGVLDPAERMQIQVLCEAFNAKPTAGDRLSVVWTECPASHTAKNFDLKVLEASGVVHRKVVKLEYNQ